MRRNVCKCAEHFVQSRIFMKGDPEKVSEAPSTVARFPFLLKQVFWGGSWRPFFGLGPSWAVLEASWVVLGWLLGHSWGALGPVLGHLSGTFAPKN